MGLTDGALALAGLAAIYERRGDGKQQGALLVESAALLDKAVALQKDSGAGNSLAELAARRRFEAGQLLHNAGNHDAALMQYAPALQGYRQLFEALDASRDREARAVAAYGAALVSANIAAIDKGRADKAGATQSRNDALEFLAKIEQDAEVRGNWEARVGELQRWLAEVAK